MILSSFHACPVFEAGGQNTDVATRLYAANSEATFSGQLAFTSVSQRNQYYMFSVAVPWKIAGIEANVLKANSIPGSFTLEHNRRRRVRLGERFHDLSPPQCSGPF